MTESEQTGKQSAAAIEAEIAATREHLASAVDELITRAQPKEIVRRQGESARIALAGATHDTDGRLRVARIVAVVAAVAAVLVALGALRRRRG